MAMTPAESLLAAPWPEFASAVADWDESDQQVALYERCRVDLAAFCMAYMPEMFTRRFSPFHLDLLRRKKEPWTDRRRQSRTVIAAPRGHAKSTLVSCADVVHDVCYGYEVFVGMISTDYDLSEQLVKDLYTIFSEPEGYGPLHAAHGPFRLTGTQTDFRVRCPGNPWRHGVRIKAYSIGGTCRGHTAPGRKRFSKWIIDDPVSPKRVGNPAIRDTEEQFLDDDLGEAGSDYTVTIMLGTRLHPDDTISRKLADPRWESRRYQALISWPARMDLWEQAREVWANLELGGAKTREDAARAFYERRREAMDAGSEVLWPEGDSLFDLILRWWSNESSFFREKQNMPGASSDVVFDVDGFARCRLDGQYIVTAKGRRVPLTACKVGVWWDPIPMGRKGQGRDEAAIAAVAREVATGRRFVAKVWKARVNPSAQRAMMWEFYSLFGPSAQYGYEDNAGHNVESSEEWARERREHEGGQRMHLKGYVNRQNKAERIVRVQPDMRNGFLELGHVSEAVLDQYRQFPGSTHDDAIDAIERADWLLTRVAEAKVGGWNS